MRFSFIVQMMLSLAFVAIAGCFNLGQSPVIPSPVTVATPEPPQKIMDKARVRVTTILKTDGGPPVERNVYYPGGIAIGTQGNLYVSDGTSRVLSIDAAGHLQEVAGMAFRLPWRPWEGGFADGTGKDARFNYPAGLVVDASGDVIVADAGNHRIRKVTPEGRVTTLAGSGVQGAQDGVGLAAQFNRPSQLIIDASGSIFVSEWHGHRIRRLDLDGTVTTIAGTGEQGFADGPVRQAKFNRPQGLALGLDGSIYVADSDNYRIRRIFGGMVTTVAGDGTRGFNDGSALKAKFGSLGGLIRMRDGDLIVADSDYDCIRRVSAAGQVTTIVGGGTYRKPRIGADEFDGFNESGYVDGDERTARFYVPLAMAVDSSEKNIYVCDSANDAIRQITFLR